MKQVLTNLFFKVRDVDRLHEISNLSKAKWIPVDWEVTLSPKQYALLADNLLGNHSWLKVSTGTTVVYEEGNEDDGAIVIQNEGYYYARYSGIAYGVK